MPETVITSPRSPDEQLEWEIRNYGTAEEELRSKVVDSIWTDSVESFRRRPGAQRSPLTVGFR